MKVSKFDIKNFKGISSTSIHLFDETPGNVVTLIGLNESGKTTILEALSYFLTEDQATASFVETVHKKAPVQDLIPKDKKAAFSGRTSISAAISLEDSDIDDLAKFLLNKYDLVLNKSTMQRSVVLERTYEFEDSTYKETKALWNISFPLKTVRAKNFRDYRWTGEDRAIWLDAISNLRDSVPRIVYFPTFLFNFPDRIYLDGSERSDINEYYKKVVQDVLDSQGEGLSIARHVVERISKQKAAFPNAATFIAHIFGLDEKSQIDAVMQKMSNEMSRVIFGAWNEILGRNISNKRVQVDWFIDGEKDNAPYIQVSIIDGQSRYALSERSLGFRWFFSFLLFTQFRKNRVGEKATIFLFDEPAANLHSKAQMKLLDSFRKIASGDTYVIYSTHSHYMVNPQWLEKAYIIDNKAIDYDDEDQVDSFEIKKTDITAIKYRAFVSSNPAKTTYFQPVLDALEVNFSPLERSSKALIVEGKFDFHPFMYLQKRAGVEGGPNIFPTNGAGNAGTLISLFRGWGVDFRILLDDDSAGKTAKKRYIDEYDVNPNNVITLADILPSLKGKSFESIYQDDVRSAAEAMFTVPNPTKRQLSLFFQQLIASDSNETFPETEAMFLDVSRWVDDAFGLTKNSSPTPRTRKKK